MERKKEEINEDILRGIAITEGEYEKVKDEWFHIPILVKNEKRENK